MDVKKHRLSTKYLEKFSPHMLLTGCALYLFSSMPYPTFMPIGMKPFLKEHQYFAYICVSMAFLWNFHTRKREIKNWETILMPI